MTTFARAALVCLTLSLVGFGVAPHAQEETQQARIARLVQGLGADDPETRDRSQRELEQIGAPALPALEQASQSEDPEVALRAGESLQAIRGGTPRSQPQPQDQTRQPPTGNRPPPMPVPDMNELLRESLKQLQDQMPPEFRDMLEMFGQGPGSEPEQPQQDEERGGSARPRVRVWSWSNGQPNDPNQPRTQGGGALDTQLGLRSGRASAALRAQLGIAHNEGLLVNLIVPGGYAEQHGLQQYDVVVTLDGRPVRSVRDLAPLAEKDCEVQLYRQAKLQTLRLPALGATRERAPEQPQPQAPRNDAKPKQEGERSF